MKMTIADWPVLFVSGEFSAGNNEGHRLRELLDELRKIAKKPQLPHKKQPTATLGKYPSGSPDFHDNLCYDIGNAVSNLSVILHPWR